MSTAFQCVLSRCLPSAGCSDIPESLRLQQRFLSPSASLALLSLPPSLPRLLLFLTPLSCLTTAPTGTCTIKNSSPPEQPPAAHHLEPGGGPRAPAAEPPGSWGRAGGAPLRLASRRASPRDPPQPAGPAAPMPAFRSSDGKSKATGRGN